MTTSRLGRGDPRQQRVDEARPPRRPSCASSSWRRGSGVRSGIGIAERLHARAAPFPPAAPATRRRRSRASRPRRRARTRAAPRPSRRRRPPSCPGAAATASATARVPAANGSSSKAPIGPFQSTVPAAAIASRVGGGGARADVEAHPAVGHLDAVALAALGRRRRSARPSTRSTGSSSSQSESSARSSASAAELDALLLDQRVAGRDPLRAEEAEAHRAADQDPVGDLEEAVDHADLVGDLGAAEDDDQRPRRDRRRTAVSSSPRARAAGRRSRAGRCATPSVLAWARWAAPKASLT